MNPPSSQVIPTLASPRKAIGNGKPADGDGPPFDWATLVPFCVHPLRVTIIEALVWIGKPLSATDIKKILDNGTTVGLVSYHVKELAKVGAIKKVRSRQVRGAVETYYKLTPRG